MKKEKRKKKNLFIIIIFFIVLLITSFIKIIIRNLAIIDLLASSGIRISELVNLNRDDINFENKSCLVFGKGKKMREVYFDGKENYIWKNI